MSEMNECPCVTAEKPVSPCGRGCWHFHADKWGRKCVNCGCRSNKPRTKAALLAVKARNRAAIIRESFDDAVTATLLEELADVILGGKRKRR